MTRAEIKARQNMPKLKIRLGDRVQIIAGKDKGQQGFIARVDRKRSRVVVLQDNPENPEMPLPLNRAIKHRKARQQGERSARLMLAVPLHISNVMVLDPKSGKPTRVGRKLEGGKLVRYAKKSGELLPNAALIEPKS